MDSKLAAKSAFCDAVSLAERSVEGVEIGELVAAWTLRRKAVLRPEKEKS